MCPREVVWLNGAPGAGKGTNMTFIEKSRGLSRAYGMSQLLEDSPELKEMKDRGELIPDAVVFDALLDAIFNPDINDGAGLVIDGTPAHLSACIKPPSWCLKSVCLLPDALNMRHA